MQNQINLKLSQFSKISPSKSVYNNQQNQQQTPSLIHNQSLSYNNLSHHIQDQGHYSGPNSMQQQLNNYHGTSQHYSSHQHHSQSQEHQHNSYFHLQPTNQNLIHKQQCYHHNIQYQANVRLKQIASYAQQQQEQHHDNKQQPTDSPTFILKQDPIYSESNKSFRPRVASVSSSSSPDSPSPRYFIRSTSFSSIGNQQRPTVIDDQTRCSNLQNPNATIIQDHLLSPNQVNCNQQYELKQHNITYSSLNTSTSPNSSTQQIQTTYPTASSQANTCSSTSTGLPAMATSISPSDALNLGINLEQYISKRNERERSRVRNVNDAFDNLKNSLPLDIEKMSKRMSKVEILRTAISYIKNLEDVLGYKQQQHQSSEQQQQEDRLNITRSGLLSNNNTMSHQESMNELSSLLQLAVTQSTTPPTLTNSQSTIPIKTTPKTTTSNVCLPLYRNQQQQITTTKPHIITHNSNNARQREVYTTEGTINENDEQHYRQQQESIHFLHQDQDSSSYYTNRITIGCLSQQDRPFILEDYQQQQQQPVECENNQYQQEEGHQQQQQQVEQQNDLMDNYNTENFNQLCDRH